MAVITLSGVGYGEVVDTSKTPALRIFNIFVVLTGVGIAVYVFSVITAFLVEGELRDLFRRGRMRKRIERISDHFIVCGLGATGRFAIEEIQKVGTPYVAVEVDSETVNRLRDQVGGEFSNMLYVVGDATDEAVLRAAGMDRAQGIIAALPSDKDNLVITVVVRQQNPRIRIVSRYKDAGFAERMLKAGANSTVSPNHIGGLRLASEVLRPHVVGFLDLMLHQKSRTLRIDELTVNQNSPWKGLTLGALDLRGRYNLLPVAVKNAGDTAQFRVNPPDSLTLSDDTVVIVIGEISDLQRARADAHLAIASDQSHSRTP